MRGGDHARRRTGQRRAHGQARGRIDRHHAAVGLDDQKLARGAVPLQALVQALQIRRHDRLEIGVQGGRRGAFELADLGQDFVARRDVGVGPHRSRGGQCRALVGVVGVGVDEHDRQRFGAEFAQARRLALDRVEIDVFADRAVGQGALGHFGAQIARDRGHEFAPQPPGLAAVAAAHLQHVAEARGHDHAGFRALALEQRVGADRRAVHDGRELGEIGLALGDAFDEADRLVALGRGDFARLGFAGGFVEEEQIGERAAHVHADDGGSAHARAPLVA